MISQKTQLETKVKDQDHTYYCPSTATLLECYEALNTFRSYVYGRLKEHEESQQSQKSLEEINNPENKVENVSS